MIKLFLLLSLLALPCLAHAQGGRYDNIAITRGGLPIPNVTAAVCQPLVTTSASVLGNVAFLTTASNPITAGFAQGGTVLVAGFTGGDTYFNGGAIASGTITAGYTILAVTSTQITYALTHANASASSNGTVLQLGNATTSCGGLSTVYTDSTDVTPATNPSNGDGLGNYGFWAAPGQYYVQLYGAGITTSLRPVSIACVPSNTVNCGALLGSPNIWTGTNMFNNAVTFNSPALFNTTLKFLESTPLANGAGIDTCYGDSTAHAIECQYNGGSFYGVPLVGIANSWAQTQTFAANPVPSGVGSLGLGTDPLPWNIVNIGSAANQRSAVGSAATALRAVNFPDVSGNVSFAAVEYCGATTGGTQACAKTVQTLPIIVYGDVLLNTAASQVITTLPFTSSSSYSCAGSDVTSVAGNISFPTYTSGAQVTIQESGGGTTDHIRYTCVGN